jgi:hypothetical protein
MYTASGKENIEIHALKTNTDAVKLSWTDSAAAEYTELGPGESYYLWGFQGEIYALAISGSQTLSVQQLLKFANAIRVSSGGVYETLGDTETNPVHALQVAAFLKVWNNTNWERLRGADFFAQGAAGALAVGIIENDQIAAAAISAYFIQGINAQVSAANATNVFTVDLRNINQYLSFKMNTSGGTATITVAVSVDNSTFFTVGSFATAANTTATYRSSAAGSAPDTTGGAYTADATNGSLHPLAFRFVKITVGAAGVGNTTTLTVSAH